MNNTISFLYLILVVIFLRSCSGYKISSDNISNSNSKVESKSYVILEDKLSIADPFVLYYNDKHYAYGTRGQGFEVYKSDDLKHWVRNENLALNPSDSWGTRWFWAPEVYFNEYKNKFYMFYSANEHINVAISDNPEGPFIQEVKRPIVSDEKGIDTSLFIDEDGTVYLYYVRFTDGNVIWVAEMTEDLMSIKTNTLSRCITANDPWERVQAKVVEGPSVFKLGDKYYMIYSANHFESKDYAVGYATSDSPLGPWEKYSGNPILRRDNPAADGLIGTGHGAMFKVKDGSLKYIYHGHANDSSIHPRTSYINDLVISKDGVISIVGKPIRPVVAKIE